MAIKDRTFTYTDSIRVSKRDLQLARQGRKTCTIRLGRASVADEFVNLTDGRRTLRVRIEGVETERAYQELTHEDALAEGLSSIHELQQDLRRYYGDIDANQPVTVISFRLAAGASQL